MPIELPPNKPGEDLFSQADLEAASTRPKENIPRRKLFLSVEGLLIDLLPKAITEYDPNIKQEFIQAVKPHDLENSLFYFGCTRDEFFNFEKGGPIAEQLRIFPNNKAMPNFRLIENAVEKAEKDGRVFWPEKREHKEGHSFEDLNKLLTQNKIPSELKFISYKNTEGYFEQAVRNQIKELNLPIDVMG